MNGFMEDLGLNEEEKYLFLAFMLVCFGKKIYHISRISLLFESILKVECSYSGNNKGDNGKLPSAPKWLENVVDVWNKAILEYLQ